MPQMSPINWTIMFMVFMLTFIFMMNKIYFLAKLMFSTISLINGEKAFNKTWSW